MGTVQKDIDWLKFDQMNARLGPVKKVNVILVGTKADNFEYIKSKWLNGKKNDIVILFSGGSKTSRPERTLVFSWSESELCKKNLQSILLENNLNDDLLPLIENEIKINQDKINKKDITADEIKAVQTQMNLDKQSLTKQQQALNIF